MATLLITGGSGFIGSNFIRFLIQNTDHHIINVDCLTYAGKGHNLTDIETSNRYQFVHEKIENQQQLETTIFSKQSIDAIFNFAAESHVDRSIDGSRPFILSNVLGTQSLLECAKKYEIPKYIQISTDEVYGTLQLNDPPFTEMTQIAPNSPYSASKAGADLLVRSYVETHKLPALITRCSNNYGPYQFPEKLIPLMIANAMENKPLPVYGNGQNIRDWIHVQDHCQGIWAVYEKGNVGEVYNLGGANEIANLDIVKQICAIVGKPESLITFVEDRKGHDFRYAMDITKVKQELGWEPKHRFEEGLVETVAWYQAHESWWKPLVIESDSWPKS